MFFETMIRRIILFVVLLAQVSLPCASWAQISEEQEILRKTTEANYDSLLHSYYIMKYKGVIDNHYEHRVEQIYSDFEMIPDSVFFLRLQSLPTIIPMTYNDVVRRYINMYVRTIGRRLDVILSLSEFYYPMFEEVLNAHGLPLELKHLAIVESALNPRATSHAGAAGLWQFMYRTGRSYGLEVNSLVDARREPLASTVAAARYLKDLYAIYNDWTLALAAYNCGPGGVNKAIARSGGKQDFWQIYNYLPRETRGYIPAFIAVNYVMNYYYAHGLAPKKIEIPVHTDTLQLRSDVLYCHVAQYVDVSVEELRELNPQYRTDLVPVSSGFKKLTLPVGVVPQMIRMEDSIYRATRDSLMRKPVAVVTTSSDRIVHKVRKGETISKIARKYGVSESAVRKWNKKRNNNLQIGERLVIYKNGVVPIKTKEASKTTKTEEKKNQTNGIQTDTTNISDSQKQQQGNKNTPKSKPAKYTVRKGDTLSEIAQKFGVTVTELKRWNRLSGTKIGVGQVLIVSP